MALREPRNPSHVSIAPSALQPLFVQGPGSMSIRGSLIPTGAWERRGLPGASKTRRGARGDPVCALSQSTTPPRRPPVRALRHDMSHVRTVAGGWAGSARAVVDRASHVDISAAVMCIMAVVVCSARTCLLEQPAVGECSRECSRVDVWCFSRADPPHGNHVLCPEIEASFNVCTLSIYLSTTVVECRQGLDSHRPRRCC